MIDFFFYAISAVLGLGCWFILKDRLGRAGIYLRRFFLGIAVFCLYYAFIKKPFDLNEVLLAGIAGFIILNLLSWAYSHIASAGAKLGGFFGGESTGSGSDHIRGAKLVNGKQLQNILKKEDGSLTVGSQKIPERLEALHFLIAGATGVGKSVAISEILDGIADRGDRVFLSDAGGNFLKSYFNPERHDLILNPLDSRAVNWSPLAEINSPWDVDQIAKSIIPDADGSSAEWNGYAQTIIAAILKHCWINKLNNSDIFRIATVAKIDELREIFAGTPAQPFVEDGNEKMFGSVRAIVGKYISPFQYLESDAGAENGFSLKKIVSSEVAKGWMFFNFRDDQLETLKPIIAAMADIISKTILSMEESKTRKFWLIIDEFASLGRIGSVLDYLTKARKNGGRAILGMQTVSQLEIPYSRAEAHTILANCSSQIVFRVPDPETSETMSRLLGDQQISRIISSGGSSSSSGAQQVFANKSSSENWQQQITNERVIMPSELQNLESLHGILNLAGDIPAAPILLEPRNRPQQCPTFTETKREAIVIKKEVKDNSKEVIEVTDDDLPLPPEPKAKNEDGDF